MYKRSSRPTVIICFGVLSIGFTSGFLTSQSFRTAEATDSSTDTPPTPCEVINYLVGQHDQSAQRDNPPPDHAGVYRPLLDAIRQVETGGEPDGGINALGDGGASLGPYQIGRLYWQDAIERNPDLAEYPYERVGYDYKYAEKIILAYWDRYGGASPSFERLARLHNGGPRGPDRNATQVYWERVQRALERE
jgi:hypothetical protein